MSTTTHLRSAAPLSGPSRPVSLLARLGAWHSVWIQRRRLADLDEHLLDDLGLTRADISRELRRPVWDVPGHWRG